MFEMPLIGVNAAPIPLDLPNGRVMLTRHEHMGYLGPVTIGSPIRYFIEPVIVMLNRFAPEYDDISMIGLSGGGWTATLAAQKRSPGVRSMVRCNRPPSVALLLGASSVGAAT